MSERAQCPFCEAEVDEDLILYGGPCPTCFTDIPGEEAPTDPGEEVKAAQEATDNRMRWIKALVPIVLLGVPLITGLFLVAVYVIYLRVVPQGEVLDFDVDDETNFEIELVGAPEDGDESKEKAKKKAKKSEVARLVRDKKAKKKVAPASDPGGLGLGIGAPQVQRSGGTLSSAGDIKTMIWRVMRAEMPKLKSCYEQRLKEKPDLQGRWQMKFTVTPPGGTRAVSVSGLNMSDAQLESCVANKISRWQFDRISQEQPVQRSISFKPQ